MLLELIAYLTGFCFSVFLGWALMLFFRSAYIKYHDSLPSSEGESTPIKGQPDLATIIGLFERPVYWASSLLGHYELAAAWLVIKAIFRYRTWSGEGYPHVYFYRFALGTLLSLCIGVVGGTVSRMLLRWLYIEAIIVMTGTTLYTVFLCLLLMYFAKRNIRAKLKHALVTSLEETTKGNTTPK